MPTGRWPVLPFDKLGANGGIRAGATLRVQGTYTGVTLGVQRAYIGVTPANAGVQSSACDVLEKNLDSRVRGNDGLNDIASM